MSRRVIQLPLAGFFCLLSSSSKRYLALWLRGSHWKTCSFRLVVTGTVTGTSRKAEDPSGCKIKGLSRRSLELFLTCFSFIGIHLRARYVFTIVIGRKRWLFLIPSKYVTEYNHRPPGTEFDVVFVVSMGRLNCP